jgi:hypothetical protein
MSVVDGSFDHPLKIEESAVGLLARGIANHGYQCGMLWGATLAAGAQSYRLLGDSSQAETEAVRAAQKIVEVFRARTHNEINCLEITDLNFGGKNKALPMLKFMIKGSPIGCFRMASRYAPEAFGAINTVFGEKHIEATTSPVSCSAMLAHKMGASDMHTVMVSGFAGGIGLSGGACGALGAAIWIIGVRSRKEGVTKKVINSRIADTIDRFLKSAADFKFECSEIVGRRFENIGDHAGYLRDGGCSKIIEVLVTK